jgi:hypothetical protein
VADAIKANHGVVKDWLRGHEDLAGVVLKGDDIHIWRVLGAESVLDGGGG